MSQIHFTDKERERASQMLFDMSLGNVNKQSVQQLRQILEFHQNDSDIGDAVWRELRIALDHALTFLYKKERMQDAAINAVAALQNCPTNSP
jgi:hypothetical protein